MLSISGFTQLSSMRREGASFSGGCNWHCVHPHLQAPILFEACIVLLTSTLDKLHAELDRRTSGYYQVRREGIFNQPINLATALGSCRKYRKNRSQVVTCNPAARDTAAQVCSSCITHLT
jgi:hypothetical protein